MGRKSTLTDAQLVEAKRRYTAGEPLRKVAEAMGIAYSTLRDRIADQSDHIKSLANQMVSTERAIMALPIPDQITVQNLASRLRVISDSMASAADLSAKTSHRLAALANAEIQKVDDADPLKSIDALKGALALTEFSNKAAFIPLNLLAANREAIKAMSEETKPTPGRVTVDVVDASADA